MKAADAFATAAIDTGAHQITDRSAWLSKRREMVTASVSSAILGISPWQDPLEAYAEYVSPAADRMLTPEDAAFWGIVLEQPIAQAMAAYHGWQYHPGGELLRSREYAHLGATLDGIVDRGQGWEDYEGKTTGVWRLKEWRAEEDGLPDEVLIQVQHQLIVTRAPRAIVTCLVGGQRMLQREVAPAPELQELIIKEGARFLDNVRNLIPPAPTAKSGDALARLYPEDSGDYVRLPDEALGWTNELKTIAADLKRLEARKDLLRNQIRWCLKDASYGVLPVAVEDKRIWQWKMTAAGSRSLLHVKGPKVKEELFANLPQVDAPAELQATGE
jgi:putative phage-type endonuclease